MGGCSWPPGELGARWLAGFGTQWTVAMQIVGALVCFEYGCRVGSQAFRSHSQPHEMAHKVLEAVDTFRQRPGASGGRAPGAV